MTALTDPLYDLPTYNGEDDYLSPDALARIGAVVIDRLPHDGFELGHMQGAQSSVTATLRFDNRPGPQAQMDALEAVLQGATVLRTLYANLVGAREVLRFSGGHQEPHQQEGGDDAATGKGRLPVRQDAAPSTGEVAAEPPSDASEGAGRGGESFGLTAASAPSAAAVCPTCGSDDVNHQEPAHYLRAGECHDQFHANADDPTQDGPR